MTAPVGLAHDYLTQRGGAERVVLTMMRAFPGAPLHTSLYAPDRTFPEFAGQPIRTSALNRLPLLRRDHRLALPLLAPTFSRLRIDAGVVLCSSSGWAHGVRTTGRKVVYCYAPARWLYQSDRYLRDSRPAARLATAVLGPALRRWDGWAAATAHRYLTSSAAMRDAIRATYGIEADVVPPPHTVDPAGPEQPVEGMAPGFFLCVSRLLPYKNVDAVAAAFARLPDLRLVVVGGGPDRARLEPAAGSNTRFLGTVGDRQLRWLYRNCAGIVGAAYEDYGLTPVEGAAFARPAAVLRAGGYLDTVVEGATGTFFDEPRPDHVAAAVERLASRSWPPPVLLAHAERYSEARFIERLRAVVAEEAGRSA